MEEDYDEEDEEDTLYTPLTCDLCQKTFNAPGDWVRHIQSHPETQESRTKDKNSKHIEVN